MGPLPVVSADQIHGPSLVQPIQACRWAVEYGGRSGTGWENRVSVVTPKTAAPFHPGLAAPHVRCPVLLQISPVDELVDIASHSRSSQASEDPRSSKSWTVVISTSGITQAGGSTLRAAGSASSCCATSPEDPPVGCL